MPKVSTAEIYQRLKQQFGEAILELSERGRDPAIQVDGSAIVPVCEFLKDEPGLEFDCLSNLSGVDYPKKPAIQVVYHLYSYRQFHTVVLKVDVSRDDPAVSTVEDVWKAANWMEREVFDLLGVRFDGHTDMRRILMPEDWVGHPLRKDFVEPDDYHGIPTRRESLISKT